LRCGAQYNDKQKQRAEINVYFKRFDEAEKIYKDMDRLDLAIDMRARLGDWFTVKDMLKYQVRIQVLSNVNKSGVWARCPTFVACSM